MKPACPCETSLKAVRNLRKQHFKSIRLGPSLLYTASIRPVHGSALEPTRTPTTFCCIRPVYGPSTAHLGHARILASWVFICISGISNESVMSHKLVINNHDTYVAPHGSESLAGLVVPMSFRPVSDLQTQWRRGLHLLSFAFLTFFPLHVLKLGGI